MIPRLSRLAAVVSSSSEIRAGATRRRSTVPASEFVFDRGVKRRQRDWAATRPNFPDCRYLKDEVGYRVADKIYDLTKFNEVCLDLGCGVGHIAPNVFQENVGVLIQCDMSEAMVARSKEAADGIPTLRVICDEELVPFRASSVDLIVSSLSAHWINNLPRWFSRCCQVLRPDGALIGAILAGDTLFELRCALQLAESERLGGIAAHISPFVQAQDIGSLMHRAGFAMITLDTDEVVVGYPHVFALLADLQGMAESNANRRREPSLRREVLLAADAIYRSMYGSGDPLQYPATFQIVSFIGWRPGPQLPKPARRGSQQASFKDLGQIVGAHKPA